MTIDLSTPAGLGNALADNIERQGHYQGQEHQKDDSLLCLVVNPAYDAAAPDVRNAFLITLAKRLGTKVYQGTDGEQGDLADLYLWNDMTPTAKVLDTLRSIG